jgi:hypothetical protein
MAQKGYFGDDLDFRAGSGRFGSADSRADQALAAGIRTDGGRQHAVRVGLNYQFH